MCFEVEQIVEDSDKRAQVIGYRHKATPHGKFHRPFELAGALALLPEGCDQSSVSSKSLYRVVESVCYVDGSVLTNFCIADLNKITASGKRYLQDFLEVERKPLGSHGCCGDRKEYRKEFHS